MYIEASSPRQLYDYAKLHSPRLKFLGNMCLQFYYHMSGSTTGSLKVSINERAVFFESGYKGESWNKVSIDVSAIVGLHRVSNIFVFLLTLGSLSNDVFERRTSTGSRLFAHLSCDFEQTFGQIVSLRVKTCT